MSSIIEQLDNLQIELTTRCNLKCPHCYLRGVEEIEANPKMVLGVVDALLVGRFMGMVILTGGEPALHSSFEDIWLYISRMGLRAGLFTNGTTIGENVFKLFELYPPAMVQITQYGANSETYLKYCGANFEPRVIADIVRRLRNMGVPTRVGYLATTRNSDPPEDVEPFYTIRPRAYGEQIPGLELPVERQILTRGRLESMILSFLTAREGSAKRCRGMKETVFVSASGSLHLCATARSLGTKLESDALEEGIRRLRQSAIPLLDYPKECQDCDLRHICDICPVVNTCNKTKATTGQYCATAHALGSQMREALVKRARRRIEKYRTSESRRHVQSHILKKMHKSEPAREMQDLSVQGLGYAYGDRHVLEGVTFRASPGCTIAVTGESGSGKSTLVNCLSMPEMSYKGSVYINGLEKRTLSFGDLVSFFGVLSQTPAFDRGNIGGAIFAYAPDAQLCDEHLDFLGVAASQLSDFLSLSMDRIVKDRILFQRILLLREALRSPPILVLDETFSQMPIGLYVSTMNAIRSILPQQLIVNVTHRPAQLANSELIVYLEEGKLATVGTHEELLLTRPSYRSKFVDWRREEGWANAI